MRRWRNWRFWLAASGLIPLLFLLPSPADPILLIYSLFVCVYFNRAPLQRLVGTLPGTPALKFFVLALSFSLLSESFVWYSNTHSGDMQDTQADLLDHLASFFLFYLVIIVAWMVTLRRYDFTIQQVFFTQGSWGIVFEQQGAIFITGLLSLPLGLLLWIYVLPVYGSTTALAYTLTVPQFERLSRPDRRRKYAVVWGLNVGLLVVVSVITLLITGEM